MRRSWGSLIGGLALAVVIAGPADAAPPSRTDPPAPRIPERYLTQVVSWAPCWFDGAVKSRYPSAPTTSCAKVKVPMDWHAPDAHPDIELAIALSRATGASLGLLATNPGGPGGAGLTLSAALALDKPKLFERYDLLGFDPRGFGESTPLRCLTTVEELNALPTTPDYRERTDQTHAAELAGARLLAKACAATEFAAFVSSRQTVYDMEFLRALLAAPKLSFIGYSYGTWLGGWYADTYPARVGRFVLDSNMDWTHSQWDNVNFDPFSFQRRRDTQLFPWIARHAAQIQGLGATPAAVLSRYDGIRAQVVARLKAGAGIVRGDSLDGLVAGAIYSNVGLVRATLDILVFDEYAKDPAADRIAQEHVDRAWARLAPELQALTTASLGRYDARPARTVGDAIRASLADVAGLPADEEVDIGSIGTVVRCNDTLWADTPEAYLRAADSNARTYAYYGYLNGVPMCAFWPHPPQNRIVDLAGSPPLLMVSSELDPATAFEGALRTHRDLSKVTRLVAIDDEGQHGQYVGSASTCVEEIGDKFLFDGTMPTADTLCLTSPLPAETSVFAVSGPLDRNAVPLRGPKSVGRLHIPNPLLQKVLDQTAATG